MKVVVNRCFGGFGLSPKAIRRLAELQGKECYFFTVPLRSNGEQRKQITAEEAKEELIWTAFSVPNPDDFDISEKGKDGTYKTANENYKKIKIDEDELDRHDPLLVQVVEELGEEASDKFAKLELVEIPDGTDYRIDEYDGNETIAEGRTW